MNTTQYTIRSIPKKLDIFLRNQARLRGKSLNQTVLDYIEQATKLDMQDDTDSLDWIVGANPMDDDSLQAIMELKKIDKLKSRI